MSDSVNELFDDLTDERDVRPSKCTCLMLIKFMQEDGIGLHRAV